MPISLRPVRTVTRRRFLGTASQFFGHVAIDGGTEVMTVTLKDWDDRALWSTKLDPKMR